MNKEFVYLETSFVSYLTARPSRDLIVSAHQTISQEWWEQRRSCFEIVISEIVAEEAGQGHPEAAQRRLDLLRDIPFIAVTEEALDFADKLIQSGAVPQKAAQDALHIAVCCVNNVDFLLTWNCKHIANAEKRESIRTAAVEHGLIAPVICTPEELFGDEL
ncbi:MAG: type II toxin-antitoxin system VapC family toxin [Candidatus Electrothrix sp. GW3-4]|uniref:Type II toxin-antitoxin system VapC family toxin n=1 Tax=Candidatus Electrothrix aestuarii TaxID=3062594 RepID=A0AAU8LTX5_9BACT|nr:type II toxin-antitoxin system VapC family toxin [Candidatus Electrothrix aestuarii]